jgi:hypothetical protein
MEPGSYIPALEAALDQKRASLETTVLPQMLDNLRILLSTFEVPYNILLKKGLVREDPYKLEEKISEIRVPPREHFPPQELNEQMAVRLSQYHSQLDYVINYYEFSLSFLTLPRLKSLAALTKYMDFSNLVETSPNPTTGGLAVLLERVTRGADQVAASLIKDSVNRLVEIGRRIFKAIADTALYQREQYKLDLRKASAGDGPSGEHSPEQNVAALRPVARAAGLPFYTELAVELVAEDSSPDPAAGEDLRSKVLARLSVEQQKEKKPAADGPAPRDYLLEALRALSGAEPSLRAALKTVREVEDLLTNKPLTFLERFQHFFARAAGGRERQKVYDVEYMDDSRGVARVEKIVYTQFLADAATKMKELRGLATRAGSDRERVDTASDDQLFELLTRTGSDIGRLTRKLEGLAALFRSRITPLHRSSFRGVHGDVTLVRSALARANRQKHEYVARVEEEAQFKKLGIAPRA